MRVLLLGGASEIGLAIVEEFVARGADEVVLAGRPGSPHREQALAQVGSAGVRTTWLDFDAADTESHDAVLAEAFERPVDVAIVAFGVLGDEATWRDQAQTVRLAQTNFTGALSVGVLLGQQLGAQGHGTLIALSSVAGERVRRSNPVYGATKAGMDGFYLQLGVLLKPAGVRVLVVRPGVVVGRMTAGRGPVPLSTTPQRVARAVFRALAAGRPVVRVPAAFGTVMAVYRHLPAAIANRLPF